MVREINLNHICKVEGHANLTLKIDKGKVKICQLEANEGARFFEALVLGKEVKDVQEIVSRICGICSISHSVASVQALESALNIKPTEKQKAIREVLMIGERIRSNATHLYFLALPDYFGFSSALTMSKKHKSKIRDAIKLISLGNKIIETFGAREIHPFMKTKNTNKKNYNFLIEEIEGSKNLIEKTINLFMNLKNPDFNREVDYLSLRDEEEYATISGKIVSSSGKIGIEDYKKHLQENIREYATSKFVLKDGKPYLTGASARLTNNYDLLDSETRRFASKLKLPITNPFDNNLSQAIELLHLTKKLVRLIQRIEEIDEEKQKFRIKKGKGVAAVEAPRGTLFHEYHINEEGVISYCNIIPPTTQNLNMMEIDIKNYVELLLKKKMSLIHI